VTLDLQCRTTAPRRVAALARGLNALDYVEVGDDRRTLTVAFLDEPTSVSLENIRIDGGRRVRDLHVEELRECEDEDDNCLRLTLDRSGDASTYTLRIVEPDSRGRPGTEPLEGFDARYATFDFTFTAGCPTEPDCAVTETCPPQMFPEPEISYLAKDYASFRQLILDRLALIMPGWTERHVPDLELTLVELLAYVGDYLSYFQDAVATEAYLGTARRRISVRRHLRLIDYRLHEGCNARAWVVVQVRQDLPLEDDYFFVTSEPGGTCRPALRPSDLDGLAPGSYEVFEPLTRRPVTLRKAHNEIELWTWGESECCLPAGATAATLNDPAPEEAPPDDAGEDDYPGGEQRASRYEKPPEQPPPPSRTLALAPGDVLIFEEVKGPHTGARADADPTHRQAVRLTRVTPGFDEVEQQAVVEVEWDLEDALCFPLCVSSVGRDCGPVEAVSVARGNVLLVDHGRSITACGGPREEIDVPSAPDDLVCDPCAPPQPRLLLEALRLRLSDENAEPLTPEQLALVRRLVGERRALEAGLADIADEAESSDERRARARAEAEALERLLDSGTSFPAPFAARLKRNPVTHTAPFPSSLGVARGQAQRLEEVAEQIRLWREDVRAWMERLWRRTSAGGELTFGHLARLEDLFGADALRQAKLIPQAGSRQESAQGRAAARPLLRLLDRWSTQTARDLRRLETLGERARAGHQLGSAEASEIEETWAPRFAIDVDPASGAFDGPACTALEQDPREALAVLSLAEQEEDDEECWRVRADLLESEPTDRHVVVEVDDEVVAHLRFGWDDGGRAPTPGSTLLADYRVGNGAAGNVGTGVISRIVFCTTDQTDVTEVRNPLAACGGRDPEPTAEAKLTAPLALRHRLLRAVTAADYAALAGGVRGVQRAAATLSWTGSWYEAAVALDPLGATDAPTRLSRSAEESLFAYRRIGHDLRLVGADYVPIDLALTVCVRPHYHRGEVAQAIGDVLSSRPLSSGELGFFHPDRLTFGGQIALSSIVAAVQAVPGVLSVDVSRFERLGEGDQGELGRGVLRLGPLEIARLDNDPVHPENGKLNIELRGGR
jgi:hypothetical protein